MTERIFTHLNESDPTVVAHSKLVWAAMIDYLKPRDPEAYARLIQERALLLMLYDEPALRITEMVSEVIEKYSPDVEFRTAFFFGTKKLGPMCGIVVIPKAGRGTCAEIMARQTGVTLTKH